ncbi:MAG: hypothetical protein V3S33_05685 [Gammaproteobacteria bacterium]
MPKAVFSLIKYTAFAIAVLFLGNWIRWEERTLSDHVRVFMSYMGSSEFVADRSGVADSVKNSYRGDLAPEAAAVVKARKAKTEGVTRETRRQR